MCFNTSKDIRGENQKQIQEALTIGDQAFRGPFEGDKKMRAVELPKKGRERNCAGMTSKMKTVRMTG